MSVLLVPETRVSVRVTDPSIKVRDLLNPASMKGGGLKIREHPNRGFYGKYSRSQHICILSSQHST